MFPEIWGQKSPAGSKAELVPRGGVKGQTPELGFGAEPLELVFRF